MNKNDLFFTCGHGGTKNTYLWYEIISKIRSDNKIFFAVVLSGIASLLLPMGRSAHSQFRIPLLIDQSSTCHIKKGTQLANLIEKTSLILWDEAPMNNKHFFEALDKTLLPTNFLRRRLPTNFTVKPFGGMTIVLCGDFRQILLVIPSGIKE